MDNGLINVIGPSFTLDEIGLLQSATPLQRAGQVSQVGQVGLWQFQQVRQLRGPSTLWKGPKCQTVLADPSSQKARNIYIELQMDSPWGSCFVQCLQEFCTCGSSHRNKELHRRISGLPILSFFLLSSAETKADCKPWRNQDGALLSTNCDKSGQVLFKKPTSDTLLGPFSKYVFGRVSACVRSFPFWAISLRSEKRSTRRSACSRMIKVNL